MNINFNNWDYIEIDDEFENHQDFYFFLVNNNILNNYIKYFNHSDSIIWRNNQYVLKKYKKYITNIKDFLNHIEQNRYINTAFDWGSTNEGFNYWEKLYNLWIIKIHFKKT